MPPSIVRFEPMGIEIDIEAAETVLRAAFRQGVRLAHGCREGQCGSCKAYLLSGHVELDPYSTFALPDVERDVGFVLLCRAHVVGTGATIELLGDPVVLGTPT